MGSLSFSNMSRVTILSLENGTPGIQSNEGQPPFIFGYFSAWAINSTLFITWWIIGITFNLIMDIGLSVFKFMSL